MTGHAIRGAEVRRLEEDAQRTANWKRWGPYLAERQWATVREDYSPHGDCWTHFSHDDARSRAYRWGEDGLLGITDRQCRLCFALALWNTRDPILKERLFGLTGPQGNHGEDVKECYYYLDATPTHSYLRTLYQYPQRRFPYEALERYHYFYGDTLRIECPTGSGRWMNLNEVAHELSWRLVRLFLPDDRQRRPYQGHVGQAWPDDRDRLLFHEYFHGDTGAGLGASHQTGWTSLVAHCLEHTVRQRG